MDSHIPSAADLRAKLSLLGHAQMQQMASCSGVPFTTLWKLRSGETADPRLETVRLLLPHLMTDKAA
jgi:transcriptional regulator with XRE-family HTH domain